MGEVKFQECECWVTNSWLKFTSNNLQFRDQKVRHLREWVKDLPEITRIMKVRLHQNRIMILLVITMKIMKTMTRTAMVMIRTQLLLSFEIKIERELSQNVKSVQ